MRLNWFIAAVIFLCPVVGRAEEPELPMAGLKGYKEYINDNMPVVFEYPQGWQVRHSGGKEEEYSEVFILGPRNKEDTYNTCLKVVMYPEHRYASLSGLVEDYKRIHSGFEAYQLFSSGQTFCAGTKGIELETGYILRLPLYTQNPKEVQVKERVVFIKKGGNYYKLKYSASQDEYPEYLPVFDNLLKSFQTTH